MEGGAAALSPVAPIPLVAEPNDPFEKSGSCHLRDNQQQKQHLCKFCFFIYGLDEESRNDKLDSLPRRGVKASTARNVLLEKDGQKRGADGPAGVQSRRGTVRIGRTGLAYEIKERRYHSRGWRS